MTPLMHSEFERRPSSNLWDTLIRIALIVGLGILCFEALSPFLKLMLWSLILAVTMYPLHKLLCLRVGNRQWLASTILVIFTLVLIVTPTWLLMNSFADSVHSFAAAVQNNTVHLPPPREGVKNWPIFGQKIYDTWSKAVNDLPGFVQSMQPKIADLARYAVSIVATIGRSMLLFLASFVVGSIIMAYGGPAGRTGHTILRRVAGTAKGDALAKLAISTIRAVALGVIGVAAIQALLVGLALLLAGVRLAGILAIITLILGIAQVPAIIVTLPVIIYIWSSGDYGNGAAILHTIILLLTGMADNILKPLMLGRGVDVPMPVILFGALGGMASGGILGMFVGATALSLGYEIVKTWLANNPDPEPAPLPNEHSEDADLAKGATA